MMFGIKKHSVLPGIRAIHYEGLDFPTNNPCGLELDETALKINRINPDVVITLPVAQIKNFSVLREPDFMLKYHGHAVSTSKMKGVDKFYLVVDYTSKEGAEKYLAFWGTASEYGKFLNLQKEIALKASNPQSYSL